MPTTELKGLTVLVVEDDPMISLLLEDILLDEGCFICGPFQAFEAALQAAQAEHFQAALLDVHLGRTLSYPIAEVLDARGIPFILLSGHGDRAAPAEHLNWRTCGKPFGPEELLQTLRSVLTKPQPL